MGPKINVITPMIIGSNFEIKAIGLMIEAKIPTDVVCFKAVGNLGITNPEINLK